MLQKGEILITYVMAGFRGRYDIFLKMLNKINFTSDDTLYVLGDIIGGGDQSVELLMDIFSRNNVCPLMGDSEMMAANYIDTILQGTITVNIERLDSDLKTIKTIREWLIYSGRQIVEAFKKLPLEDRNHLLEQLKNLPLYKDIWVGKNRFILVHTWLGDFKSDKPLIDYTKENLLCHKNNFERCFSDDNTYIVSGHSPTLSFDDEPCVSFKSNHIRINSAADFGGAACLELETLKEYFIYPPDIF